MSDSTVTEEETAKAAAAIAAIERGRLLFAQECEFVMGVRTEADLPLAELPEVAFAGRSNVGKSSLLNALTNRNTLARTSNTPGRTREVNFFRLGGQLMLVDLPGYGYAKAGKEEIARWNKLIEDYLRGRSNLRRVCLLIDARRGIGAPDRKVMELLDKAAVVYQIILTKVDKEKAGALAKIQATAALEVGRHGAAYPDIMVTSSAKKTGLAEVRAACAALAETTSAETTSAETNVTEEQ
ncbi:MAG: YihA family ribosome biogenesis GTP-binding protein [Rhodospirillaceae bacterium]|jgi:GTP-binding protein|nr:YihA family ribosome biogenesis GTP-binding protein [Rhodospirillaceae bacterium]MBT4046652.1 YihA family ribosome biogenesis GTP-binding protein [Rhodospirillaceae bacterium]MBT4686699.1 YihA family ribosome biogenesis GTP-binding protein [Rhodospirillaceae bacterium]MBT5079513.1 YihA family ribosome biogenesis GTP-binding protein [Rhodospirillaceae bacterium]MBT5523102.1 YihA family ribosome biogenesis GTP-binding protein [Rhodospirillaceae bacterium]